MKVKLRLQWSRTRKLVIVLSFIAALIVVIALIILGYWFDWTGFDGYTKVTRAHVISGANIGTVTRTEEYQPGKGLWDWLNLLGVFAIPVVVGFGVAWYTVQQGKATEQENKDNQREAGLRAHQLSKKLIAMLLNVDGGRNYGVL